MIRASCQSYLSRETKARQVPAMVTKSLEAQSLGIKRETMPKELEEVVDAIFDQQVNAIVTLGPVEHGQPRPQERLFLTAERFNNPGQVTRTVNLEEFAINLGVMPEELETVVKKTVDQQVNAIITLGPDGQERTFLTRERFKDPDDPNTLILQKFPIESPKRITSVIAALSGVGYLLWESSPDCQTQYFPGNGSAPVPGHEPVPPDGHCP
jgi:hypothetical protein